MLLIMKLLKVCLRKQGHMTHGVTAWSPRGWAAGCNTAAGRQGAEPPNSRDDEDDEDELL